MRRDAVVAQLEALYRDRFAVFVRVAASMSGDGASGHDAVQEAFARAIEARRALPRRRPARSVALADRRQHREDARGTPSSSCRDDLDAGPTRTATRSRRRSSRGSASLPERQRLAVFLRYWADLDYRSIAAALEIEVGTVSATLSAAHTTLRRSLQEVPP